MAAIMWNDYLPKDVWWLIISKLTLPHHIPFGGVCRLWRSMVSEYRRINNPIHVPALVIPGCSNTANSQTRQLLAYPVGKQIQKDGCNLPLVCIPHRHLCRGSYQGWLVLITDAMDMYLYNPLTGARIDLPPASSLPSPVMSKWDIHKAVLSASPSSKTSDCCFVLVFYGNNDEIAFCKVGNLCWRSIDDPGPQVYVDAVFNTDKFYIVDIGGRVYASDLTNTDDEGIPIEELVIPPPTNTSSMVKKRYLVELGGEFLQITREIVLYMNEQVVPSKNDDDDDDDDEVRGNSDEIVAEGEGGNDEKVSGGDNYEVEEMEVSDVEDTLEVDDYENDIRSETEEEDGIEFEYDNSFCSEHFIYQTTMLRVFKLDTSGSEAQWIEVKGLNGGAVFIGMNQSFALPSSNLMGYERDRIYYTDDTTTSHGNDMGVFRLEDSSFNLLYLSNSQSVKPHPVWITLMP